MSIGGFLKVSIISESEGDPAGVYQAATTVTLTCSHNGSSSVTYSWACSGESNCFTQHLMVLNKRRGVLRGEIQELTSALLVMEERVEVPLPASMSLVTK